MYCSLIHTHRTTALSNTVCASSGENDDSYNMCMSPELPLVSGIIRDNEYYNYLHVHTARCM